MNTKCSETSLSPLSPTPQMFNVWSTLNSDTPMLCALTYATFKSLIVIHFATCINIWTNPSQPSELSVKSSEGRYLTGQ